MNGYRVFTWNGDKFPDVPELLAKAKAQQLRIITIVDPGVKFEPGYAVFDEGRARNLFCKTEAGNLHQRLVSAIKTHDQISQHLGDLAQLDVILTPGSVVTVTAADLETPADKI